MARIHMIWMCSDNKEGVFACVGATDNISHCY